VRLLPQLALSLLVVSAAPAAHAALGAAQEGSLEAYLKRIRAEREAEAERLRGRGHAQAARFSWRRCADETLRVYRAALG